MPSEFKKQVGRVENDSKFFTGFYALRAAQKNRDNPIGEYIILAPDMDTLRTVWARLNAPLELIELKVGEISIFDKKDTTNA